MTFHESTVKKLRWALNGHLDHLEEANRNVEKRRQALADAQEELGYAEERAATLTANVADCQRWLDFAALCDTDEDLAHAFANAVLNRDAEMAEAKQDWADGHNHGANCTECRDRYEVEKHVDVEARIEREFETHVANEAWLDAHPDDFDPDAESEAAQEAWIAQGERAADEAQAAKDAEAQDDAWSTAEQIEHDQDCEFAQDAADQERWAAEAALDAESGA